MSDPPATMASEQRYDRIRAMPKGALMWKRPEPPREAGRITWWMNDEKTDEYYDQRDNTRARQRGHVKLPYEPPYRSWSEVDQAIYHLGHNGLGDTNPVQSANDPETSTHYWNELRRKLDLLTHPEDRARLEAYLELHSEQVRQAAKEERWQEFKDTASSCFFLGLLFVWSFLYLMTEGSHQPKMWGL